MIKVLYVGPYTPGCTSWMRANKLKDLMPGSQFEIIDTHIPFNKTSRIFQSIGFRFKMGPLVKKINRFVLSEIKPTYDLIWIDKAIFIQPMTISTLRKRTSKLVHYTPDTAFFQNNSELFNKSIPYYDFLITTKSFDLSKYPEKNTLFIPQGFDPIIHNPRYSFKEKSREVVFIGLYEPYRGKVIQTLLNVGIRVTIAGKKWKRFKGINHPLVEYLGEGLFGEDYARVISSSQFGLGLLSKRFPELHTTRTFEIPASGTALITERNAETTSFFNEDEAIFYDSAEEMVEKVLYYKSHLNELESLTNHGLQKVLTGGYDYETILRKVLEQIL